jgi:hypothetical protein
LDYFLPFALLGERCPVEGKVFTAITFSTTAIESVSA